MLLNDVEIGSVSELQQLRRIKANNAQSLRLTD